MRPLNLWQATKTTAEAASRGSVGAPSRGETMGNSVDPERWESQRLSSRQCAAKRIACTDRGGRRRCSVGVLVRGAGALALLTLLAVPGSPHATAANIAPDADDAPLVALLLPPGPADVVVVTAKAPTAPRGDHPVHWPAPGEELRYWSLCTIVGIVGLPTVANRLPNGTTDYGCRDNDATKVDAAGYYFYVIGREAQRSAVDGIAGVTFLPLTTAKPSALHVLYLRNKLASPGFAYAVQRVTQYGNPAAAAAVTGPYYPRAAVCPLRTLVSSGPQACLRHP